MKLKNFQMLVCLLFYIYSCNSQNYDKELSEIKYHQESYILHGFIKLYKEGYGNFPEELGEMEVFFNNNSFDYSGINKNNLNSFLTDPFSNEYYVYKATDNSFILYSVGPDGNNDNSKILTNEITSKNIEFKHLAEINGIGDILIYHYVDGKINNIFTDISNY